MSLFLTCVNDLFYYSSLDTLSPFDLARFTPLFLPADFGVPLI